MSKTVSKKLGNKYRSFSKQNKTEGGSNDGSVSYGEFLCVRTDKVK